MNMKYFKVLCLSCPNYAAREWRHFYFALYYIGPVWIYCIFPHYLIKSMIFEKIYILKVKRVFDFLYNFCLKGFLF